METKNKGYIVERDYDGDSDNYVRYIIRKPDGTTVARGVYEYELKSILKGLPDISKQETEQEHKSPMNEDTIKALATLRHTTLAKSPGIYAIMDMLCKYYPPGTQVIITKDYWKVEEK